MANRGFFAGSTTAQSTAPAPTVPQCGACGLYRACRHPKLPVSGAGRRGVLVVGSAPGKTEDENGGWFVGPAGQMLRKVLQSHNINLDQDCWLTSALICRPAGSATPTAEQVRFCQPNLLKAVRELKPTAIVLLGGAAIQGLLQHLYREDIGSTPRWYGWRIPSQELNAWVYPTYGATEVERDKDKEPVKYLWWAKHLGDAFTQAAHGRPWPTVPDYRRQVEIVLDTDRAAGIIREMVRRGGPCAWDYEANMLKPDGDDFRIVSCSICWRGKRTIAYPWAGDAITATQEFIRSPLPKIASNMKYEDRATRRWFGHGVREWAWDTMIGGHWGDPRREICGIKFQGFIRLGFPPYNAHIEPYLRSKGSREVNQIIRNIDLQDLLLYNGLDSLIEYKVAAEQIVEGGYPWKYDPL